MHPGSTTRTVKRGWLCPWRQIAHGRLLPIEVAFQRSTIQAGNPLPPVFLVRASRFLLRTQRGKLAKHRIHHARSKAMTSLLRQLDALIDRRVRRNPIQMQQLKCAQPQRNQNFCIELRVWVLEQPANPLDRGQSASAKRRAREPSSGCGQPAERAATFLPRNKSSE